MKEREPAAAPEREKINGSRDEPFKELAEPSRPKSFFERLTQSPSARVLALLGMLGMGKEFLPGTSAVEKKDMPGIEQVEQREFDLGEMARLYEGKVSISNEKRHIVHIGQVHGGQYREQTEKLTDPEQLIRHQKGLEELILMLQAQYRPDAFYLESMTEDDLNFFRFLEQEVGTARESGDAVQAISRLQELFEKTQVAARRVMPDSRKAHVFYFLKSAVDGQLSLDGKIKTLPAETYAANAAAFKALEGKDLDNMDPDLREKLMRSSHEVRDEKAVEMMTTNPDFARQSFVPVIYGANHDFSDNMEKYNKAHPGSSAGLITITPRSTPPLRPERVIDIFCNCLIF